ncbi:hypothetical protein CPB86DRAFT_282277 [Serendipita vermifera]|nr:hypothetical protein CPB86DRAFT_282277 [Serendipita vermifera]
MKAEELPPTHSEYPTELPDHLPIGQNNVRPLVNVAELQAHLKLLAAFYELKREVQGQKDGVAVDDNDQAWLVFVNRAVHRFFAWTSAKWNLSSPGLSPDMMPPLDVMMVWHTYLLNPRSYYEDQSRMSNAYAENLQTLHNMPLTMLATLIDSETLKPVPPSGPREETFRTISGMPYQMPFVTTSQETFNLTCPRCLGSNSSVHWFTPEGQGFAQPDFSHKCEHCQINFDKANLGIWRFAEEVSRKRAGENVYISECLLHHYTGVVDTQAANKFMTKILSHLDTLYRVSQPIASAEILSQANQLAAGLNYSPKTLLDSLHRSIAPSHAPNPANPRPRLQRIVTAYSHHGPACLDLVGAVLRQGSFIEKMADLGWTTPGRFGHLKDSAPLVRCIARYHAFLDLMSQNSGSFLVPTLDIDLAWHTHQLKGGQYRLDTQTYLQYTPNHDDNVEEDSLSNSYDTTAKAWEARYGVPYRVCGCIPDSDSESALSQLTSKLSALDDLRERLNSSSEDSLINAYPDPVTPEDHDSDTSDPPKHNLSFGDLKDKHTTSANQIVLLDGKVGATKHEEAFTDSRLKYGRDYAYWGVSAAIPLGFYSGHTHGGGLNSCDPGGCSNELCRSGGGNCYTTNCGSKCSSNCSSCGGGCGGG